MLRIQAHPWNKEWLLNIHFVFEFVLKALEYFVVVVLLRDLVVFLFLLNVLSFIASVV